MVAMLTSQTAKEQALVTLLGKKCSGFNATFFTEIENNNMWYKQNILA
jgi:hypothetical protein